MSFLVINNHHLGEAAPSWQTPIGAGPAVRAGLGSCPHTATEPSSSSIHGGSHPSDVPAE